MDKKHIIVSETPRPFWQLPIAALLFTAVIYMVIKDLYYFNWSNNYFRYMSADMQIIPFFIAAGIALCSRKKIYVDIENSKFKPTLEVGSLKFGKWKTIHNYEYVSVFHQPLTSGDYTFEVNLWYDKNKHFELYSQNSFEDAMSIGYDLSEQLNINLLDATIPNDFKWIDKEALKRGASETKKA
ncbi:hypothetical protein [Lacinutrix jangbogonensis]|uniref:hypothetical protein n=1 Tax=Lacinutrix jangbogonensis TaxID=1469557 RepID=UPI00053D2714|nr:hypothetical protein [Lacinutrix jangbogonensis]